jgi:hypothetical protein
LRAIAVEHYTVCPIHSPELVAWFEKEVQHRITPASICHADRPSAPPPRDVDFASTDRRCLTASQVDPVKLNAALSPPALQIWPSLPTNVAPAPEPLPQDCYVTRPGLLYYGDTKSSTDFSSLLLKEAHLFEILRAYPHPNMAQYLGCIVGNGSMTISILPSTT